MKFQKNDKLVIVEFNGTDYIQKVDKSAPPFKYSGNGKVISPDPTSLKFYADADFGVSTVAGTYLTDSKDVQYLKINGPRPTLIRSRK
jgi:hypothetical protein